MSSKGGKGKAAPAPKKAKADRKIDKASNAARSERSAQVSKVGPLSPIWKAEQTVQDLGTQLGTAGTTLATDDAALADAETVVAAARTKRDTDVVAYDAIYNAYTASAEHYAVNAADLQALGLVAATEVKHGLGSPLDVKASYNAKAATVDVVVKRAPGMRRCRLEIASDQAMTANLKQFPGDGCRQAMAGLPPGTYWAHAAHVNASGVSAFVGPVAVIVK